MSNFLEQLTREWYEYQGYFVRQNILVGKRAKGGHDCELDIVAFHPKKKHLIHIEPSMDASSWEIREARYKKKFAAGKKHIPTLFAGLDVPNDIEQVALLVFASTANRTTLGGGKIVILDQFLAEMLTTLRDVSIAKAAIPEQLTILRTLQFVSHYRSTIEEIWSESKPHC